MVYIYRRTNSWSVNYCSMVWSMVEKMLSIVVVLSIVSSTRVPDDHDPYKYIWNLFSTNISRYNIKLDFLYLLNSLHELSPPSINPVIQQTNYKLHQLSFYLFVLPFRVGPMMTDLLVDDWACSISSLPKVTKQLLPNSKSWKTVYFNFQK